MLAHTCQEIFDIFQIKKAAVWLGPYGGRMAKLFIQAKTKTVALKNLSTAWLILFDYTGPDLLLRRGAYSYQGVRTKSVELPERLQQS